MMKTRLFKDLVEDEVLVDPEKNHLGEGWIKNGADPRRILSDGGSCG